VKTGGETKEDGDKTKKDLATARASGIALPRRPREG